MQNIAHMALGEVRGLVAGSWNSDVERTPDEFQVKRNAERVKKKDDDNDDRHQAFGGDLKPRTESWSSDS